MYIYMCVFEIFIFLIFKKVFVKTLNLRFYSNILFCEELTNQLGNFNIFFDAGKKMWNKGTTLEPICSARG